ncbi:N-acetyltransferase [Aquaticitalea lipolytica]|uniref:N-acetyltransferase n=1 Tax=Aquaticitalea lipolytica TaxID=1247562 RepID=A0A8J2TU86_9FLAO|nr:GNAT family N-acetyltransferase [Aquaticitalea lipolytica]GFZ84354.1 N-acetyltransferase [Aquaticitalea lipolytica]
MNTIIRATVKDAKLLVNIGKTSFIESHGMSASKEDIDAYVSLKFNETTFTEELQDSKNHFYIIYHNETAIGYSKIIFDVPHKNIDYKNVTKLERLYLLSDYHHLKLGLELFNFNVQISKKHQQAGMWLFVWIENTKAIKFYNNFGFKIIGSHDFEISKTHSNPNHQMLLTY